MPPVSEVEITSPEEGAGGLSRSDCLCPVCLEIFLEPVTLPCTHTFCKSCFLETVDKANMCCPLCRKRVSTWARHNSKRKSLVNVELWQRVQKAFPEQCQRRLSGQEEDFSATQVPMPKVCQPGELRREYEDEVGKLERERVAREEAERRASEEFIQRLLAEDQQRLEEEKRRREESQQQDEWLARQISQELNSDQVPPAPPQTPPVKKKPAAPDIQRFFGQARNKHSSTVGSPSTSSLIDNKENIRNFEVSSLAPVRNGASPSRGLPPLDYYGPQEGQSSARRIDDDDDDDVGGNRGVAPPLPARLSLSPPHSPFSIASSPSSSQDFDLSGPEPKQERSGPGKRKSGGVGDSELGASKRPCPIPSSSASLVLVEEEPGPGEGPSMLQRLTQQEAELEERRRQEEEDRRLALQLQRQLDREEHSRATDRSKDSADPYALRQRTPRRSASTPQRQHGDDADAPPTLQPPRTPRNPPHSSSARRDVKASGGQPGLQGNKGKTPKRISASPSPTSTSRPPGGAVALKPTHSPAAPQKKGSKQTTIMDLFGSRAT